MDWHVYLKGNIVFVPTTGALDKRLSRNRAGGRRTVEQYRGRATSARGDDRAWRGCSRQSQRIYVAERPMAAARGLEICRREKLVDIRARYVALGS